MIAGDWHLKRRTGMKQIIAIVLCAGFLMLGVNVYAQKVDDDTSRLNRFGLHNVPFDEAVAVTEEGCSSGVALITSWVGLGRNSLLRPIDLSL